MWDNIRKIFKKHSGKLAIFFGIITAVIGGALIFSPVTLPAGLVLTIQGLGLASLVITSASSAVFIFEDGHHKDRRESLAAQQEQERMQYVAGVAELGKRHSVTIRSMTASIVTPIDNAAIALAAPQPAPQQTTIEAQLAMVQATLVSMQTQITQYREEYVTDRDLNVMNTLAINRRVEDQQQQINSLKPTTSQLRPSTVSMFQRPPRRVGLIPPVANEQILEPIISDETVVLTG